MLGYADMREAVVWIQLQEARQVYALYDDKSTPDYDSLRTEMVSTSANVGYTAKLYFRDVEPGHRYTYQIWVDGERQHFPYPLEFSTEPLWDWRKDPPAFAMALGSCAYVNDSAYDRPGRPYGGDYQIFDQIRKKEPDAMLWLGDNIYLREADWWTRSGYLHRYTHTRSLPELQALLAACNHFAIWDDHDFGPNDANGAWPHKDLALEMFKLFWANYSYGYRDLPGIMSAFNYQDIDVFLLDNRYHRSEQMEAAPEQILGKAQIERLINLLKHSRLPYKLVAVGGQLLNSAAVYENHSNYEEEREYLLRRLGEEKIKGVIVLSGDRHHSEVSQLKLSSGEMIYEFTVSPLTSGANRSVREENAHRVAGSLIQERNFALLEVKGPRKMRQLQIRYFNAQGEEIYRFSPNSIN